MHIELISKFKNLGFTENEAKIHVGIFSLKEATVRETNESNQEE